MRLRCRRGNARSCRRRSTPAAPAARRRPVAKHGAWAAVLTARSCSWRRSRHARNDADAPSDDLHGDLGRWIGSVVARAVHLATVDRPVALGQHGDGLGPGAAGRVGTKGRDIPLVGAQRTAGGFLAARQDAAAAQTRDLVERDAVARKTRCAGLSREPANALAGLGIEDLFAGGARGAVAVAV